MSSPAKILPRFAVGLQLAHASKRILIAEQNTRTVRRKDKSNKAADADLVTTADTGIDTLYRQHITRYFPGDTIISEDPEKPVDQIVQVASNAWANDSLDGTTNFANGRPPYASSSGHLVNNIPIFGTVVWTGRTGLEVVSCLRGQGIFIDGVKVTPRTPERPAIGLDVSKTGNDGLSPAFAALQKEFGEPRVLGSIVSGLTEVALGSLSAYVCVVPKLWDVAAALVFLQEAGRAVTLTQEDINLERAIARPKCRVPLVAAAIDQTTLDIVLRTITPFGFEPGQVYGT